ncbi:hypothetical protein PG999_001833 [Apiospora kogelbergensis]|uniref:Uncharacterized protein n=1 Tax=Apiospora kogelbergensis TaxID=1337665 RepID=A0AAW0R6Q6_9PEZI
MDRPRTRTTKVVLLYWDNDYRDNSYVKSQVNRLQEVPRDSFGFKVACHAMNQDVPLPGQDNQQNQLANFLLR